MRLTGISIFVATSILLNVACSSRQEHEDIDVCDAIRRAPELLGKPIRIAAAYDYAGYWSAIGSSKCPEKLIEPRFGTGLTLQFRDSSPKREHELRDQLASGFPSQTEFQGRFHGTLRKRTNKPLTGPHAPPGIEDMPYVFDVERVEDVKLGRSVIGEQPPPPPPDWR
jgi:hypothetical protein